MMVAGFGLRAAAVEADLRAALALAGVQPLNAIAAPADKADHPALRSLAKDLNLPLCAVALVDLRAQHCQTLSMRQPPRYGAGSVAEAAALAAAGPGAKLISTRQTAADGMVTIAIAEGAGT